MRCDWNCPFPGYKEGVVERNMWREVREVKEGEGLKMLRFEEEVKAILTERSRWDRPLCHLRPSSCETWQWHLPREGIHIPVFIDLCLDQVNAYVF